MRNRRRSRLRRFAGDWAPLIGTGAVFAVVVGSIIGYFGAGSYYGEGWRTCAVTGKDRGASSDGSSHYRIYTRDCGVLADEDNWIRGKTNSADIFGQVQPGRTYQFHVVGFRFGPTSDFPNILATQPAVGR